MSDADILVPPAAAPGGAAETTTARPALSAAKQALREARLRGLDRSATLAPRVRDGSDPPLSFAQERLWFLERLQPGLSSYNLAGGARLSDGVDAAALERALTEVVRRHESLRTTFREVEGVPVQVIAPFVGFVVPVQDLTGLDEAAREAEVSRRAAEEAARPFDLRTGPLFRAQLLRMGADDFVLLLCLHHIVTDGWSMNVLFREIAALHAAYRDGGAPLPEPALQYADYAVWQRGHLRGQTLETQLTHWRHRLAGAPELLPLPTDRPRPAVPSHHGSSVPVEVPGDAAARLRALAWDEGATLYMVVLAAFQVVLGRWGGSEDVVVGTPVAGRTRREVEGLIGLFVNTLVLRTDLSGDPDFRTLVRRVRRTSLDDYAHQDVPFERLVAELQPERTLSHATLFQVMFQMDDSGADSTPAPSGEARMAGGVRARAVDAERSTTKFDLTLALQADGAGIRGTLEFSTDLFDRATALRMAQHLERVLVQVAAAPDRPLSRLELMGSAEQARLAEWNHTAAPYPSDTCIHELFEAQARRTPDARAVTFPGGSMTYAELDAAANRIAHHLRGLGVGPEVRVGLLMERGSELLPALLGVMKAGGAYVPLDRAYPAERLAYMLADSAVPVLLTQERLRELVPVPDGVRVVAVDAEWERIAAHPTEPPATTVTAENLAYVIYTSGSTGRPKGVAMHHRGVANYIHWGIGHYGADRGSGAPVFSSMAVDLTITNLLPLFAGHVVHLLAEDSPVEALAEALRGGPEFGLIKITPIHLSLLNALLAPGEMPRAARTLVIGADFLSAEPTVPWQEHAPGVRLMNEYGPTETVVGCSAYTLPNGVHRSGPVPVGGPIQNLAFHVLDGHGRPVPIGLPGELYIGGTGVARGYLGRPGLTAEKFVPDPFAGAGARMYRTGDRARWLESGGLTILGRTDGQLKVRGYRVEPGEVEAVLRRHPAVRDCLVTAREDRPGDRRLVAYVVGDGNAAALRAHLEAQLPEYMVPAAFVRLNALPQTATGKIDPRALPAPEYAAGGEADPPRNYVEVQLIQLWEELLGVEGIGPGDGWFELGGNSFLALRLFAQVHRRLGCDLPLATLFSGGTVRHMADAVLRRQAGTTADASIVPLQPAGDHPPLCLVHSADRNVMGYLSLVRHLGVDQPAWGIRDVGEDLGRPVAQIAAEHVRALRAAQPRGPYFLCGWSFGGFVAFEAAVQLEAAGETVAFVGVMDTMSPTLDRVWPRHDNVGTVLGLAEEHALRIGRHFSLPRDAIDGLPPEEQTRRVAEALRDQDAALPGFDAAALDAQVRTVADRYRSRDGYTPGRFSGTLTLFRAEEGPPEYGDFFAGYTAEEERTLGWCRHGRVEVRPVPGSHASIASEPHVRALAREMRAALGAARARVAEGRA